MNGAGKTAARNTARAPYAPAYTPMRKCTGVCRRRKSIGQFKGDSTVCIRCARRAA